ncbi:sigma factor-like helix-turn-helix DNA-binding protein [[Actinomadura] parvosata]|uniref:sigma factor-like helix-turn-helix DNA-binding protein n=1 Tax=[Actinomadura] parvosata TaxID=1955412 RepID=UPI00406C0ACF
MATEHPPGPPDDEGDAPARAFEQHEPLLRAVVLSMLGDAEAAEEVVSETRARWLAPEGGPAGRPESELTRLATTLALARLSAARQAGEEHIGPWLPEPLRDEPGLSLAESVSAAVSTAMWALRADERLVFLLRHGFGFSYADIAAVTRKPEEKVRRLDGEARFRIRGQARPPR